MNCQDVIPLLQLYSDVELELIRHVEIERHLAECVACRSHEQRLQALREEITTKSPYYRAPESLRNRFQATIGSTPDVPRHSRNRSVLIAIGLLLTAGFGAIAGWYNFGTGISAENRLADLIVASHVRSLQVDHLVDVASSDRHVVKPWFQGNLDFSPQVPELTRQDYVFDGGRLDYLADQPVAGLVYHLRRHVINVLQWPDSGNDVRPVLNSNRKGFHLRHWKQSGMVFWVISDVNNQDLDEFVKILRANMK